MSATRHRARAVEPTHLIPGGRVAIHGEGFEPSRAHEHRVYFGDQRAQIVRVSRETITAVVPDKALPEVTVQIGEASSEPLSVSLATTVAEELQPVANPVFDRARALYVTLSGARGEKVPVSIFRIDDEGDIGPYSSEIVNPTGLAWGPDDCLYVSSRHEGAVYRMSSEREVELLVDELGVATGLAFDRDGILYVGDRRGTIFRIEPNGEPRAFCHLEPSVAAYHLAFDREGVLYVSAPSLSSVDPIYRVGRDAEVSVFCSGFGRPQGMAFDEEGNLYVTEGLAGESGVYRLRPGSTANGTKERVVSSPPLVGLAFDGTGGLVLAGASSVFRLDVGLNGQPLT